MLPVFFGDGELERHVFVWGRSGWVGGLFRYLDRVENGGMSVEVEVEVELWIVF